MWYIKWGYAKTSLNIGYTGIVEDHYIVKTHKELKKVKADMKNKKNINDESVIEEL